MHAFSRLPQSIAVHRHRRRGAVGRNDSMASSAGERATQIVSQVLRIIQLHRVGQATIGKVAVEQAICRNLRKRRTILRKGEGQHMKLDVPAGEC